MAISSPTAKAAVEGGSRIGRIAVDHVDPAERPSADPDADNRDVLGGFRLVAPVLLISCRLEI
jgi:hypothetical protein